MKIKPISILFPLGVLAVAITGNLLTLPGMGWYHSTLVLPTKLTPPDWAFSVAWTTIFIAAAISGTLVWNKSKKPGLVLGVFALNGVLNVLWSALFFAQHALPAALIEMLFLEASLIGLHLLTWKISKWASALLLPYTLWVAYATLLTYNIVLLNS